MGRPSSCDSCGACERCRRAAYMRGWWASLTPAERSAKVALRDPARVAAAEARRAGTPRRRASLSANSRRMNVRYPERRAARVALNNALRDGRVAKAPCRVCGSARSEAHHDDYSRPLDVRWLCRPCHRAHHEDVALDAAA